MSAICEAPAPAAWLGINEGGQAVVCAWCSSRKEAEAMADGREISHGICEPCKEAMLAPMRCEKVA